MITLDEYNKVLSGYRILDCAVRTSRIFYFAVNEDYTEWPDWDGTPPPDEERKQRLVVYWRDDPEGQQWTASHLHHFSHIIVEVSQFPKQQAVVSCLQSGVYVLGGGEAGMEDPIAMRGATTKMKNIGQHLYACGNRRDVFRRTAKSRWEVYGGALPSKEVGLREGFVDIDGFAEDDIYAVGGKGDIWRSDGSSFRACGFPSNLPLSAVCCAPDGQVYVGCQFGHVFKGREDQYRRIHEAQMTIPFNDMVWYDGRVWCTSDYGVWVIEDDELKDAELKPDVKICAGNLSVRDGVLLLAGHGGAAVLEDGAWTVIYHAHAMRQSAAGTP